MGCGASADLTRNGAIAADEGNPVIRPLLPIASDNQGLIYPIPAYIAKILQILTRSYSQKTARVSMISMPRYKF